MAAVYDAVYIGQPQTGSFAFLLGGEIKFEDFTQYCRIDPRPRIGNRKFGKIAGNDDMGGSLSWSNTVSKASIPLKSGMA